MNNLDKQYTDLLQDILDNGVTKSDRTGTGTLSVFGRQIRHKMSEGFPLLTTKKMPFKTITTELLWFLRGDSDIRFLWENNCKIWDGDWEKNYKTTCSEPYTIEEVKQKVKDGNHSFHDSMFDMGPIYGKQWRKWKFTDKFTNGEQITYVNGKIDQIANLINDLKTNPDSRRLLVSAWNPADLPHQVLPPCHYGFQVYTRELSLEERRLLVSQEMFNQIYNGGGPDTLSHPEINQFNVPTRSISLMWLQRSVDTGLGLSFNISSYSLLLMMIAKQVNMVPDEVIGNLGDVHLYLNHIEPIKEQLTREPYPLPTVKISDRVVNDISEYTLDDITLENYQSHPPIKMPLSN
jgi:thymidylate synthase